MSVACEHPRPYGFRKLLEAVKKEVSVSRLVEDAGVTLKRHGSELRGVCPIHRGDNATAFVVYREGSRWRCFRCSEGGDVLELFERLHLYTDRKLALMDLAATYNVEPPGRPESWHDWNGEKSRRRDDLRDVLAESYRRRLFRLYRPYLETLEPEVREREGRQIWRELWRLARSCAENRLQRSGS